VRLIRAVGSRQWLMRLASTSPEVTMIGRREVVSLVMHSDLSSVLQKMLKISEMQLLKYETFQ
jgi:hypothetical protein